VSIDVNVEFYWMRLGGFSSQFSNVPFLLLQNPGFRFNDGFT